MSDQKTAALQFAAEHLSSDWPERCQEIVRRARAALAEQPRDEAVTSGDERRHVICLCPDCTTAKLPMDAVQRPAFSSALRGLVESLSRTPLTEELRFAAHELTVMADRISAKARRGEDEDA